MSDNERINRILGKIEEAWKAYPDFRLGQLIATVNQTNGVSDIEDVDFERNLDKWISLWKGVKQND
ncbi:hypothetical protein [[Clostridium] fimetarium]|uniref:Uncharacterized protein n=1 Tax=[Clostridium] fimetarium TaxID=99656 RepID=A0A1I0RDP5_9FIRM|nr:hypothetical protein [[Clostridium] fimetarium]SEW38997.1 hypothetical protein SAMN05421659_11477 [[Clostridium] fimetarium]